MQPFILIPNFKDYLWGGTKLVEKYGKKTSIRPVAESWEVSCHPDGTSVVKNGPYQGKTLSKVLTEHPEFIGGDMVNFPILVKLIDAQQSLSLQVHPKDSYAWEHEGEQGKNEMWYVIEAEPNATLIIGCNHEASSEEIRQRIENNTILELANIIPVRAGDCYAIPAGTLHAIGAGVLIAEVQQNSNTTYRVYDYDRRDANGNPRELHIDKAIDVIDSSLTSKNLAANSTIAIPGASVTPLLEWDCFYVEKLEIRTVSQHKINSNSFQALLVTDGTIDYLDADNRISLVRGESLFIPAEKKDYSLQGPGTLLRIALEKITFEEQ